MALIAYDSSSESSASSAASKTWSHTCTGDDRILFVYGYVEGSESLTATYNGQAMTEVTSAAMVDTSHNLYLFYIVAPATGANNIILTNSGTSYMFGHAVSYTGVAQTSPIEDFDTDSGNGTTTSTTSLTTTVPGCWAIQNCRLDNGGAYTPSGSLRSIRLNTVDGGQATDDSDGIITEGVNSCVITANSGNMVGVSAAFKPADFTATPIEHCVDDDTVALWHMNGAISTDTIAFDANTPSEINPTSDTISHTCTGTDGYLVVGVLIQSSQTCTGVTYNGVAMTQLTTVSANNVSGGETDYLFGLANPDTGANDVVASFSGAGNRGLMATSFTGVAQANSVDVTNTGTGASGTATVSVTTTVDNDWLVGYARGQSNTTASTNTTMRGAASNINMMDSNGEQTPTGSKSLNFTTASNNNWASQVVALTPVRTKVEDESSNSLDLTEVNTPTAATGFDGEANGAYDFNGSDEYCNTTTSPLSSPTILTLEGWVYLDDTTGTAFMLDTTGGSNGVALYRVGTTMYARWRWSGGGGDQNTTGTTVASGQWYYIVLTTDGTYGYLYIDGVLSERKTFSGTSGNLGTGNLTLGALGGGSNYANCKVDEVQISTRLKSAEEIAKYYSGTVSAKFYPAAGAASPVDGVVRRSGQTATWPDIRATQTDGTDAQPSGNDIRSIGHDSANATQWAETHRSIFKFDTSTIGASTTVSLTTLSIMSSRTPVVELGNGEIVAVGVTTTGDADIVVGDYDIANFATGTDFNTRFGFNTLADETRFDIEMNTAGKANVDTEGITSYGLLSGWDVDGDEPTIGSSGDGTYAYFRFADDGTATNHPYLWVEYSVQGTIEQTATSKARIQHTPEKAIQSKARVQKTGIPSVAAKSFIDNEGVQLIQAKSRISQEDITKTTTAKARVQFMDLAKTITAKSKISVTDVVRTITAKSHIWSSREGFVSMRNYDQNYNNSMSDGRILE